MSKLNEKIRILIENNELTQAKLAEKLFVSESTVQKWVSGDNMPRVDTLKDLCQLFDLSLEELTNEDIDIPEYYWIDKYLPDEIALLPEDKQDSEHVILDADLAGKAMLHRFVNAGGAPCSAIYVGRKQIWWDYREHEIYMLHEWNREHNL